LLAVYALWLLAFFSCSSGKLATYVLPAFPALAVLTARVLRDRESTASEASFVAPLVGFSALAALAPIGVIAAAFAAPALLGAAVTLLPASLAGAWAAVRVRRRAELSQAMAAACVGCLVTTLALDRVGGQAAARLTSDRDLAAVALRQSKPKELVVYRVRPFSFIFYTGWKVAYKVTDEEYRRILSGSRDWLLLTKRTRLDALAAVAPGLRYRTVAQNERHLLLGPEEEHLP
jgi:4-amino-4-deoxy-L-arabinose transferase-like glycosyltransferase